MHVFNTMHGDQSNNIHVYSQLFRPVHIWKNTQKIFNLLNAKASWQIYFLSKQLHQCDIILFFVVLL